MHYICNYNFNWADEADFEGFEVITQEEHDYRQKVLALIEKYDIDMDEVSLCFGTNEYEYYPIGDIIDPGTPITDSEYEVFNKFFGNEFGYTPRTQDHIHNFTYNVLSKYKMNGDFIDTSELEDYELEHANFLNELLQLNKEYGKVSYYS